MYKVHLHLSFDQGLKSGLEMRLHETQHSFFLLHALNTSDSRFRLDIMEVYRRHYVSLNSTDILPAAKDSLSIYLTPSSLITLFLIDRDLIGDETS